MFNWAERNQCRHQSIVAHFGEQMARCDTSCDWCTSTDLLDGLARPRRAPRPRIFEHDEADRDSVRIMDDDESALFEELRHLRREIAGERGVPAYVVFSDATLLEMAALKPSNDAEMLGVNGVGPKKLETYGERFLEIIGSHL